MAKYKIKKTGRKFLSSRGKAYWYEVYKKKLGLFWSRQFYLEDYFVNDEEAEKEIKMVVLLQQIAKQLDGITKEKLEKETVKVSKDIILKI